MPSIPSIYRRFTEYHHQHPQVYAKVVEVSRGALQKGYDQWAIKGVVEIIRWFHPYATPEDAEECGYKLPNDFAPYYSRLVMMREPDLYLFFKVRPCPADHEMGWAAFVEKKNAPLFFPEPQAEPEPEPEKKPAGKAVYICEESDEELG